MKRHRRKLPLAGAAGVRPLTIAALSALVTVAITTPGAHASGPVIGRSARVTTGAIMTGPRVGLAPRADASTLASAAIRAATAVRAAAAVRLGAGLRLGGGDGHGKLNRVFVRSGNGRFNKNYTTVLSPTVNRGLQQVSNTNVTGRTNTQVAFCRKKHRVCRISQKLLSD